jgi:hypothetical protein
LQVRPAHTHILHTHQTDTLALVALSSFAESFVYLLQPFIYAPTTRDDGDDDEGRNATTARVQGAEAKLARQLSGRKLDQRYGQLRGDGAKVRARFDPLRPRYRQTTVRKIMAPTPCRVNAQPNRGESRSSDPARLVASS